MVIQTIGFFTLQIFRRLLKKLLKTCLLYSAVEEISSIANYKRFDEYVYVDTLISLTSLYWPDQGQGIHEMFPFF